MSSQFNDYCDTLTDADREELEAGQDDGRQAFEDEQNIMFLDALGTTDDWIEPMNMDPQFAHYEGTTEHDMVQSAIDLRNIGWTEERILERVREGLKAA